MSDLRQKGIAILAAATGNQPRDISDRASIGSLDGWDSLAHMRIMLEIETIMGRELEPEEVVAITNLEDIVNTLSKSAPNQLRS